MAKKCPSTPSDDSTLGVKLPGAFSSRPGVECPGAEYPRDVSPGGDVDVLWGETWWTSPDKAGPARRRSAAAIPGTLRPRAPDPAQDFQYFHHVKFLQDPPRFLDRFY